MGVEKRLSFLGEQYNPRIMAVITANTDVPSTV